MRGKRSEADNLANFYALRGKKDVDRLSSLIRDILMESGNDYQKRETANWNVNLDPFLRVFLRDHSMREEENYSRFAGEPDHHLMEFGKRAVMKPNGLFGSLAGKRSGFKPNGLFGSLGGKRSLVKPNGLFSSMGGKRSFKPNGLFGSMPGKRSSLKPNGLFIYGGKRAVLKPNSLFNMAGKRSLKPNGMFSAMTGKRMSLIKPNGLFAAAVKRIVKPNGLFSSLKREPFSLAVIKRAGELPEEPWVNVDDLLLDLDDDEVEEEGDNIYETEDGVDYMEDEEGDLADLAENAAEPEKHALVAAGEDKKPEAAHQ